MKNYIIAIATAALTLTACNNTPQWEVSGKMSSDAAGKTIYLQSVVNGKWTSVDSTKIDSNLSFSIKGNQPSFPDIYRLQLDGSTLYFPIDSINTISVDATNGFEKGRISGSHSAEMMQRIEDIIANATLAEGETQFSEETKREVASVMMENLSSIASYYAINKSVGSVQLFNPAVNFDKRLIGGVATQFMAQRPNDPKSQLLSSTAINNQRLYNTGNNSSNTIEAQEIPFYELNLRDVKGVKQSLTEVWNNSKVIVLNFTALTAEQAPAYNIALNEVYDKYRSRGVEIYQVGCDDDEFAWEASAKNLPWVAVYNSPINEAANLINYNVAYLPTTFVISGDGSKMERINDISTLDSTIAKML